jgi:hypothetical protein
MTDEDEMTESDPVTCPAHYAGDGIVDCKRAIRSMLAGYDHMASYESAHWSGCALKYLWRWTGKGGAQDLLKARECIDNALRGMGEGR